jgi:hypothetical protein
VVAEGREVLELEVVEEEQAHRVHGKHVDRKRTRSMVLGAASLLVSLPRTEMCRS